MDMAAGTRARWLPGVGGGLAAVLECLLGLGGWA
jgi:hypothetical protein